MNDALGPTARALLEAAREGLSPDPAAVARVRAKVGASVAGGTAAGATIAKLALVGVVGGAIAIGGLAARGAGDSEVTASTPNIELAMPSGVEIAIENASRPRPTPPPPRPVRLTTEMEPMIVTRRPPPPDLAREVALLDQAMAALNRDDATTALAVARTHARETRGSGQLAEDAAAIEVEALCRIADPSADDKLTAFDARWPHSAQRARLLDRCNH